jgi:ABC-2 type transport system ATP-binding protein
VEISVHTKHLSKSYNGRKAIDDISIGISTGELFGFIGPDGVGKSTLFRILATLLVPDRGNATVEGFDTVRDYKKIRRIIGYMPGRFSLYQDLSVEENLKFFASIFKASVEENYYLIRDIFHQLEPFRKRPAGKLSGGMKQKLALSCALIHKPSVLILDEPTTGVDAVSRIEFWDMLGRLKNEGITILVSTPYMDEAVRCDRVALMLEGKVFLTDAPENIAKSFTHPLLAVKSEKMYQLLFDLQAFPGTIRAYRSGEYIHAAMKQESGIKESVITYLNDKDHMEVQAQYIPPSVEDRFIMLMK